MQRDAAPLLHNLAGEPPSEPRTPPLRVHMGGAESTTEPLSTAPAIARPPRLVMSSREALAANPLIALGGRSELSDTFKLLRSRVVQRMEADGHRVLAMTSPRRFPGKSVSAANLAIALAASFDASVLLIDADLTDHSLQRVFGLEAEAGLFEYLTGQLVLEDLLILPGLDRMCVIPAGRVSSSASAELVGARVMRELIGGLRRQDPDRWILVDLPPMLESADAVTFLPQADTTLLFVEEHRTRRPDLERCAELLAPFSLLGTVMAPVLPPERTRGRWGLPWKRGKAPGA